MVLEKKIFKFCQGIFVISLLSSLQKRSVPLFEQMWNSISFTHKCFGPALAEIGSMVLEKMIFKSCQLLLIFPNYLPMGKGIAHHLNKLDSPYLRMLYAMFCWNWPSGSGEDLQKLWVYFYYFPIPLWKCVALHLCDFLCFVPSLNLDQLFWRRKW